MNPNVPLIVAFAQLIQSDATHFILPLDMSDEASNWLLSQSIQHEANDLYIMGLEPTGCCLISIPDDIASLAFRMWGDEQVIGPVIF